MTKIQDPLSFSRTENKVIVEYLDDKEDDEHLTYDIVYLVVSAAPSSCHVVDLHDNIQSSVSRDQSVFVMKERDELIP